MKMTQHAQVRSQQRGIPLMVVELLGQFGAKERAGGDAVKLFFDKKARRRVMTRAGHLPPSIEGYLNVYAVLSGKDEVITVGHRLERIRRQ